MKKFPLILLILFLLCAFQNVSAQKKTAKPKKAKPLIVSCGVCTQKAIYLPKPEYPKAARFVRVSGEVQVEVLIDEKGNIESAKAVSGHTLLRAEAVKAALKAKFEPLKLSGKPVKVRGILVYNFVLDEIPQSQKDEDSKREDFFPICSDCLVISKLISLPKPDYPKEAVTGKIFGKIEVQIKINEQGNVIEAKAISGNPLFFEVSVGAAFKAKFKPATSLISGKPIESSGVIVFNFVP